MTTKSDPALKELRASLTLTLAHYLDNDIDAIAEIVIAITEDWRVVRQDYPHRDDNPLSEVRFGHCLVATLPFVPEGNDERVDREARDAARAWAAHAWMVVFDPAVAVSTGYPDDDPGPPPQRVGANQLLQQGLWWRARMNPDSTDTEAIRLADMTHSHRLALLAFLRRNAETYKLREDWSFTAGPGPSGDAACDAFEAACDQQWATPASEWLEDQPLVQALVYWTTPVAESPLTWRPMNEAPRIHEAVIVVRYRGPDGEQTAQVTPSLSYEWVTFPGYDPLTVPDGHGGDDYAEPIEWRELRDDELPTPVDHFSDTYDCGCGPYDDCDHGP